MTSDTHKWLIIPVEVKHREFLSRILITALAVNRGYRVLLGKDTMIRRLAPALPRGVLFDKSLGTARHGKPQRFNRLGYQTVVLDEESTGYYGSPEQFLSVRLADETLKACRRWYCISDALRDHAKSLYPNFEDRFVTTGLLRTDTWRKAFHGFYKTDTARIREEHGKFILFNSNFGGIIHARGDAFVQKQLRGQKAAFSEVEERAANLFKQSRKNLDAFLKAIPKVADAFPSHKLIIRPHPSETIDFWREKFGDHSSIEVVSEGVVTPWILASDALFHHGCTTGIEAAIMQKPHVMYAPHADDHHDTEVMNTFSNIVKTQDDLINIITGFLENAEENAVDLKAGETYFANLTGRLAVEEILDDIDQHTFSAGSLPERLPLAVKLRLLMANKKRRSKRELAYAMQKWPGTSISEIENALAVARDGLGKSDTFAVREVYDEVFEISRG